MPYTDCGHRGQGSCGRCDACRDHEMRMAADARAARQEAKKGRVKRRTDLTVAHARASDPATSHAAAAKINVSENQRAVLIVLRMLGEPVLDELLVKEYTRRRKALQLPEQSESGIRSRRAELANMGKLEQGEKARMKTGGIGRTWGIKIETEPAS